MKRMQQGGAHTQEGESDEEISIKYSESGSEQEDGGFFSDEDL